MRSEILEELKAYEPELIEIRRDIHRHPETGFEEVRTAGAGREQAARAGASTWSRASAAPASSARSRAASPASAPSACAPTRRAAHPGGRGPRARLDGSRQDARLRPRRPHGHAARRRALPCREHPISAARCISSSSRPRKGSAAARRWSRTACSSVSRSTRSTACTTSRACRSACSRPARGRSWPRRDSWTVTFNGTGGHGGAAAHLATDTRSRPRSSSWRCRPSSAATSRRSRPPSSASAMSAAAITTRPTSFPRAWSCAAPRARSSRTFAI